MSQPTPPGWYPDPSGAPGHRYFDGHAWTDQRAPAQPAAAAWQAPQRERPVWPWILLAIVVVILVAIAGCVALVRGFGSELARDSQVIVEQPSGPPPTAGGADFPGKRPDDIGVLAGGSATSDDIELTSSALSQQEEYGNTYLCTRVTMENAGDQEIYNTLLDWTLQDPSGISRNATMFGSNDVLASGELTPGDDSTGDVCFRSPVADPEGTYVVLFEPTVRISSGRVGWVNEL